MQAKIELLFCTPEPEKLIEQAARTCYKSQCTGDGRFLQSLIKRGHESVIEHASATFRISNVSRSLTHQLVRHRLASFSQQSQRYVSELGFEFVVPESIIGLGDEEVNEFNKQMAEIQSMYEYWKGKGIKNEDARFVLPNACSTEIVISANFRQWRHIFEERCDSHAQWEIRNVMNTCLEVLNEKAPNIFGDLMETYRS